MRRRKKPRQEPPLKGRGETRRAAAGGGRTGRSRVGGISATEAARRFSDLLNRVEYRGERVTIERGGKAVCEMAPARMRSFRLSELAAFLDGSPSVDDGFWNEIEATLRSQPILEPSAWES